MTLHTSDGIVDGINRFDIPIPSFNCQRLTAYGFKRAVAQKGRERQA